MSGLYEIWNDGKGKLSEEKIQAYLEGTLSPEEQREVEFLLSEETMESDALEGLKQLPVEATQSSIKKLDKQLHQFVYKNKRRARPFADNKWSWLAIILILLLCILAYFILHFVSE